MYRRGNMLPYSSRLSLFFLRGFFGARRSQNPILWERGQHAAFKPLGGLRFAWQGQVALWVSPLVLSLLSPVADVCGSCAWHNWGKHMEVGNYRSVTACFPPRAAEFRLWMDQELQLPQAGDGLSKRRKVAAWLSGICSNLFWSVNKNKYLRTKS